MDAGPAVAWFISVILAILFIIRFFSIWHLVSVLRENSRVISVQLDQLLRAQGVADPVADRQKLME